MADPYGMFGNTDYGFSATGTDPAISAFDANAYLASVDQIAPGFGSVVQSQAGSAGEPWYTVAMRAMSTVVMTDYQRKLLNIQIERAKNGQAPLDMSNYGVGVSVGISPDVQKLLLIGGAAIVLVMLMKKR